MIRQYEGQALLRVIMSPSTHMGAGHASTSSATRSAQGGHAIEGRRRRGQGRGGHRRRRDDRRRRIRGDPPGRRAGTPIVVVLNDNGMSIAPNVGALSRYFNRVRLNPKLWHTRESVEERLTELPGLGRRSSASARS